MSTEHSHVIEGHDQVYDSSGERSNGALADSTGEREHSEGLKKINYV